MAAWKLTRTLGKRIEGEYIHRQHPLRRWRRIFTWGAGAVSMAWFAFAGVRFDADRPRLVGTLYNPGPVTEAHAYFEHDCTQCHTGGGTGVEARFSRGVTDAACLVCHDGAIHHANQKLAQTGADASRSTLTLAVSDPNHPAGATSAACATCHVEHRGHVALAATSDAHCIVCHEDLGGAAQEPPAAAAAITAFDLEHHPKFGRRLLTDGKWRDPTPLKFNHKVHQREVKPPAGMTHNCTLCHQSQDPPSRSLVTDPLIPPYSTPKDRAMGAANFSDRRFIQPVSYARHCAACHALSIGDLTFAHEDLSLVRAQIGDIGGMFRQLLASKTPEDRDKALTKEPTGRPTRRRGGAGAAGEKMTEDQWVQQQIAKLNETVTEWFQSDHDLPGFSELRASATSTTQPAVGIDPNLLEYYVVYGATVSCVKCHETNAGTVPSMVKSAEDKLLATLPTGIPASPRRWFSASVFNHDAHRSWSCVECHAGALKSEATSDVLLPDMDTRGSFGASCADCHDPHPQHQPRVAPATCATCHLYHDRTRERPADGSMVPSPVARTREE